MTRLSLGIATRFHSRVRSYRLETFQDVLSNQRSIKYIFFLAAIRYFNLPSYLSTSFHNQHLISSTFRCALEPICPSDITFPQFNMACITTQDFDRQILLQYVNPNSSGSAIKTPQIKRYLSHLPNILIYGRLMDDWSQSESAKITKLPGVSRHWIVGKLLVI